MIRHNRTCGLVGVVLACGAAMFLGSPSARADHLWSFTQSVVKVEAPANSGSFPLLPAVQAGTQGYAWEFNFTTVYLELANAMWMPATTETAKGTAPQLPFSLLDTVYDEKNPDQSRIIQVAVKLSVDAAGQGRLEFSGITWGQFLYGDPATYYPVTGIGTDGWVDVQPVPEPAGSAMLLSAAVAMAMLCFRRRVA